MNKAIVIIFLVIASMCMLALIVSGVEQLKYERVVTAGVLGIIVMPLLLSMGEGERKKRCVNQSHKNNDKTR